MHPWSSYSRISRSQFNCSLVLALINPKTLLIRLQIDNLRLPIVNLPRKCGHRTNTKFVFPSNSIIIGEIYVAHRILEEILEQGVEIYNQYPQGRSQSLMTRA